MQVRKDGYAYSIEEFSQGVITIAAPIYDYTGKVIVHFLSIVRENSAIQRIPFCAKKVMSAIGNFQKWD